MGRRSYRLDSFRRAHGALLVSHFDPAILCDPARKYHGQITKAQVVELAQIARAFVIEVGRFALGTSAAAVRKYGVDLATALDAVIELLPPPAFLEHGVAALRESQRIAAHDMKAKQVSRIEELGRYEVRTTFFEYVDMQNAYLDEPDDRFSVEDRLPALPGDPISFFAGIRVLHWQVSQLAEDLRLATATKGDADASEPAIMNGRAAMLTLAKEIHAWAGRNGLPRSAKQSEYKEGPTPLATLAFAVLVESNQWLWSFFQDHLHPDELVLVLGEIDQTDGADAARQPALFPMPLNALATAKIIEEALAL